jgi:hypothetical protein
VPITNAPALRPQVLKTLKDIGRAITEEASP